jgi:hypothetical protein
MKRADVEPGKKHRLLTASWTLPSKGPIRISYRFLNRTGGFR